MNKSAKDNHSAQSIHLLLDTNVWIDNFFVERPKSKEARALITTAIRQNIPLYYSASTAIHRMIFPKRMPMLFRKLPGNY